MTFRILIARYTLDDLPFIMSEAKTYGLAERFEHRPEYVAGNWMQATPDMDVLNCVCCVQAMCPQTLIRIEVA